MNVLFYVVLLKINLLTYLHHRIRQNHVLLKIEGVNIFTSNESKTLQLMHNWAKVIVKIILILSIFHTNAIWITQ